MNYNIRLTIKSIIRAEQMLSKPFTEIDYTNEEERNKLLYCSILSNNDKRFTYEEFKIIARNDKQYVSMIRELKEANTIMSQFSRSDGDGGSDGSSGSPYIKDIIGTLIMSGLDASFAMNEMEIADIPVFMDALNRKKREEMEAGRLWTFLTMAPHIDTKKVRSPKDIMVFPWEEEEMRRKGEEAIRVNEDLARRFFSGEFNPLKNN